MPANNTHPKNLFKTRNAAVKEAINAALALRAEGEIDTAVELLRDIENQYPKETSHFKQLANFLALAGDFGQAIGYFKALAAETPDDVTLKLRIADCYTGLQQHQQAIDVLKELYPIAGAKQKVVSHRLAHHKNLLAKPEGEISARIVTGKQEFEAADFDLSTEQDRILSDLRNKGIAFSTVSDLLGETETWESGLEEYKEFERDPRVQELIGHLNACEDFNSDLKFKGKHVPSKITYDAFFNRLDSERAIAKVLMNDRILEVAWSYYETACKLRNPLMWINPRINEKNISGRKGSQLWHRDQEDASILKCFVYYSDINAQSGATEYLLRSCERFQNNQYSFHPFPFSSGYPNQKYLEQKILPENRAMANAKAGTIVFLDTNGFHRGGFVREGQRHISMCTFVRPHSPVFDKGKSILLVEGTKTSRLQDYSCL